MKILLFSIFILFSTYVVAIDDVKPISNLPIDSKEKAIAESNKIFTVLSCISKKWKTVVAEKEDRWVVTLEDIEPFGEMPCMTYVVSVCKADGVLITNRPNQACST